MIDFRDIEIRFGDFCAVRKLNISVQEGHFFTFLGPSGCGKTTTLRALAGFVKPSSGEIAVRGKRINETPIEKRGIGMVFQSYALFPTMTVRENISFGLKEHKWKKEDIERRVREVAAMVNLNDSQLERSVAELSGGQQQRVAIARALALKPQIIVLDEPLSNLDAKLRKSLRLELKKIQKASGCTMIYVTHDQEEALTLSDQIAVFNEGSVEQVGSPQEIYYKPASEFVCNFIGESNRLSAELLESLAKENPNFSYDPQRNYYLRIEDLRSEEGGENQAGNLLRFQAEFLYEEFAGITSVRSYRCGHEELRSLSTQKLQPCAPGQQVWLHFDRQQLLSFPQQEQGPAQN